jgi:hypothetical protein
MKDLEPPQAVAERVLDECIGLSYDQLGANLDRDYAKAAAIIVADRRAAVAKALEPYVTPQPRDTWEEEDGPVLWWLLPVSEPPYCGTPLDDDFPEYMTHWTQCPEPLTAAQASTETETDK